MYARIHYERRKEEPQDGIIRQPARSILYLISMYLCAYAAASLMQYTFDWNVLQWAQQVRLVSPKLAIPFGPSPIAIVFTDVIGCIVLSAVICFRWWINGKRLRRQYLVIACMMGIVVSFIVFKIPAFEVLFYGVPVFGDTIGLWGAFILPMLGGLWLTSARLGAVPRS